MTSRHLHLALLGLGALLGGGAYLVALQPHVQLRWHCWRMRSSDATTARDALKKTTDVLQKNADLIESFCPEIYANIFARRVGELAARERCSVAIMRPEGTDNEVVYHLVESLHGVSPAWLTRAEASSLERRFGDYVRDTGLAFVVGVWRGEPRRWSLVVARTFTDRREGPTFDLLRRDVASGEFFRFCAEDGAAPTGAIVDARRATCSIPGAERVACPAASKASSP
ncbi:MAG: hypothetical protein ACAI25_09645 [Planctomycetota bacterium]